MIPYFEYQFRVITVGNSMVGKSSLLRTFAEGSFSNVCDPTVGVDFYSRIVRISNGKYIKLQLWDTAGSEKFRSIAKSYYRNCVGVLVVFDITDRSSYESVSDWYEEALHSIKCPAPIFIIIGHKEDRHSERQVSTTEAENLAQRLGDFVYIETSSLTGTNITRAFELLAESIYSNMSRGFYEQLSSTGDWDGIKVSQNAALAASLQATSLRNDRFSTDSANRSCCS